MKRILSVFLVLIALFAFNVATCATCAAEVNGDRYQYIGEDSCGSEYFDKETLSVKRGIKGLIKIDVWYCFVPREEIRAKAHYHINYYCSLDHCIELVTGSYVTWASADIVYYNDNNEIKSRWHADQLEWRRGVLADNSVGPDHKMRVECVLQYAKDNGMI